MSTIQKSPRPLFGCWGRGVARALQETIFPEQTPYPGGADHLADRLAWLLQEGSTGLRIGIRLVFGLLDLSPLLSHRRRFSSLSPAARSAWLTQLAASENPMRRVLYSVPKALAHSVAYENHIGDGSHDEGPADR